MEQLFDESFPHEEEVYRTLWYGYFSNLDEPELIDQICRCIQNDLQVARQSDAKPVVTSWIFYREEIQHDALKEQIRSSVMIQLSKGQYSVQYNQSDFEFVARQEAIKGWVRKLERQLAE